MIKYLILIIMCLSIFNHDENAFIKKEIELKKEWIRKNPVFKCTTPSFFNSRNSHQLVFFSVEVTPENNLFICDCENKFLKVLKNIKSNKFSILKNEKADPTYLGVKLIPSVNPGIIILVNNKTVNSKVLSWYKTGLNECPGTHIFPLIKLEDKEFNEEYNDRDKHRIIGIVNSKIKGGDIKSVLGIYSPKLTELKKRIILTIPSEHKMKTIDGKELNGFVMDLDNDKNVDVFWFIESIDETTEYFRIYLNINGEWCCEWVELIEECV